MKSIYTLFAAAAAMLAGCSETDTDNIGAPETNMIDVAISASGGGETRVSYDDRSMLWQSGDEVAVVVASQSAMTSTLTASTGGSSSTMLKGRIPQPADIDDYYAVYPADAVTAASDNGKIVTVTIPEQQGDTTKPILTAKCEQSGVADIAMTFTPATAILDITVSRPVISVKFEACDGEGVAGEFLYDISQGKLHDRKFDKKIIEYLGGAGQTRIRMLVPPLSFSDGYKLTLTDTEGHTMVQSFGYHSSLSLAPGKAYPVNIDFVPISIDMGQLETTYSNYIARDLTAANDFSKRLTISGAGATIAGASSTMIEEVGYYFGEEKHPLGNNTKSFAIPDIEVASQGNYTVQAYAIINGTEYRSTAQTCIVTGLPINGTPKSGEWEHSSGTAYVNFHDTYVRIGSYNGTVTPTDDQWLSRSFNIPGNIDVSTQTYFKIRTYHGLATRHMTATVKLSGATLFTQASPSGNSTAEQTHTISKDGTITNADPTFRIDSDARGGCYADIYTVDITYR